MLIAMSRRGAAGARLAVVAALALAGCSDAEIAPGPGPSAPSPEPRTTLHPDAGAADAEGRQDVALGEAATILDDEGEPVGTVTLLEVDREFECDGEFAEPPANDGFIGLRFEVTTPASEEYASDLAFGETYLSGYDAAGEFLADEYGTGYLCAEDAIGPFYPAGETETGWIVLDASDELAAVATESDRRHDLYWQWRLDD